MKTFLAFLCGCLLASGLAVAQDTVSTPNGAKSDAILAKIHKVDMLVQLLPLTMRKEQFEPILSALDKARQTEKKTRTLEDTELAKLDADMSDAIQKAFDKGTYPPKDMQLHAAKVIRALGINRQIALGEMIQTVYDAVTKTFNAGQIKVMENSLDAAALDPSVKKESMDSTAKVKFFVRAVFLDSAAYDLLIELQKKAS